MVPPPPPTKIVQQPAAKTRGEPGFEELLTGSFPYRGPEMPAERPTALHFFLERDDEYFAELQRLKQAVVMHTGGFQWDLSADNAADYACRTNMVKREEIQISALSGSRFLIMLPEGLDPETFINATPQEAWDEGLSFQPWSPWDDAAISVPTYKILLRLVGLPPHLRRERYVIQAVSRFGVFLGSVDPEESSSLASWLVAVGVDDLTLVPPQLVLHIGGMVHTAQVYAEAWHRSPIYSASDMPNHPKVYRRPQPPPPSSTSSEDDSMGAELIPMSSIVLRDICRGRTTELLPPELRRFATLEEMSMEDPHMATENQATQDPHATHDHNLMPHGTPQNNPNRNAMSICNTGQTTKHTGSHSKGKGSSVRNESNSRSSQKRIESSEHTGNVRVPRLLIGDASCSTPNNNSPHPEHTGNVPHRILLRNSGNHSTIITSPLNTQPLIPQLVLFLKLMRSLNLQSLRAIISE